MLRSREQGSLRQGKILQENQDNGSSSIKFYRATETADLNGDDVAIIGHSGCTCAVSRSWDSSTVSLKQPNLDNSSNIVIVSIDSALASWTKLERFQEQILGARGRVSYRILKRIL